MAGEWLAKYAGEIIALGALVFAWYQARQKDIKARNDFEAEINKIVSEIKVKQEVLWTFWNELNKKTAQLLISPHTPELDRLLRKWINDERLSHEELGQILSFLREEEREADLQDGMRRMALAIQIASVQAKLKEFANK
jgi:hypothetical protein